MNRRSFLVSAATSAVTLPWIRGAAAAPADARHLPATVKSSPALPIAAHQRPPFGWKTITIGRAPHAPVILHWPDLPASASPTHFRLAVGLDERDEKKLDVRLPQSGRLIGTIDLRFVTQFQLHELPLTARDVADLRREGLALQLASGSDLEFFSAGSDLPDALRPHLLVPGRADATTEFYARMESLACIQQFGWMEGCVLDGLLDLGELPGHVRFRTAAQRHLDLFFRDGRLVYENHLSAPSDGKIYGIEGTLPFAALARLHPQHPALDLALEFLRSRRDADGVIIDGKHTSSEGAYTVGYPLALLARARGAEELAQLAITQLNVRQARLFNGETFWRTSTVGTSGQLSLGNRNWARGLAWELLGIARTLDVLRDRSDLAEPTRSFAALADFTRRFQRTDGLWSVFIDEPTLAPDTAGSAGIAAAFALGVKGRWLGPEFRHAAARTLTGLRPHLTADGFLGGVSQSNKGGESLQRGNYRSVYQMGMGLKAQLIAALSA